jgi:hypothetical protein
MFLRPFSGIPYSIEQGNFPTKQGFIFKEQGKGALQIESELTSRPAQSMSVYGGRTDIDLTWVSWTKLCERMSLERS